MELITRLTDWALILAVRAGSALDTARLRAARARLRHEEQAGEMMDWLIITIGVMAAAGIVVLAITAFANSKSSQLSNY